MEVYYKIPILICTLWYSRCKSNAFFPGTQHNDRADTFVATHTVFHAPLHVGLQDGRETLAINNVGWGRRVKESQIRCSGEVSYV